MECPFTFVLFTQSEPGLKVEVLTVIGQGLIDFADIVASTVSHKLLTHQISASFSLRSKIPYSTTH